MKTMRKTRPRGDGGRLARGAVGVALREAARRIRADAARARRAGGGALADGLQMAEARVEEMIGEAAAAWASKRHAVGP